MKLSQVALALLACAATVNAQYFSEGWAPGKPVTQDPPLPAATQSTARRHAPPPVKPQLSLSSLTSYFDLAKVLESGPVSSLFDRAGINITERVAAARASMRTITTWDPRIPLITDENYDEIIVGENLTDEEKEKRSWFVIVTAQSAARGNSKQLDAEFDSAFNTSLVEGDLPDIRWARIDYLNVTYITTKWNIWQAPYVVLIRDQGQTMYFYQATSVRLTAEILRSFLLEETWKSTVAWKTPFSPGGDYEWLMHYWALSLHFIHNIMIILPRWALMLLSGAVASLIMRVMHKEDKVPAKAEDKKVEDKPAASETAVTTGSTPSTPSKKSAKSRKGKK
ncbi:hypothetical protein EUX98_g6360 [Antrodiella citrinella]|uniref:Thioredoxin-like fold domain-containing protein n=1 Tax=Antrodiella citrinella TaxID=2447956 RepID=A0A4S4MWP1_9APHY|nr:hypothetical protein EUX98_g6360 [Antrodiella citrinella]